MAKETKDQAGTGKAVIVNSLSLSLQDWNYLKSLAIEIAASDATEFRRYTTSQAVRHLIAKDRERRPKDKHGNPLFGAGLGQVRVLDMATGTTTIQTVETVVDFTDKKRARK